jgi:hypothetical protein
MNEQELKDCGTMAMLVDRSGIAAALASVNVMAETPEEPNGWRAAVRIFEQQPRAKYLLAVTDTLEATENYTPRAWLCLDDKELDSALLEGLKNIPEGALTFWMVHGGEMTQALLAKKLKHPLKHWS